MIYYEYLCIVTFQLNGRLLAQAGCTLLETINNPTTLKILTENVYLATVYAKLE
jgi:hypothetical protein